MEPVRLDPADPLASVLRWLAALAAALGIDASRLTKRVELNRASAAVVRACLAEWSRQLRRVIHAEALRLAAALRLPVRTGASPRPRAIRRDAPPAGRMVAVSAPSRRAAARATAPRAIRRSPGDMLNPAEDAVLRRRTRAVLLALMDPSAATRRLARRFALRFARSRAERAARRGRLRFPHPPRALRAVPRDRALEPELHPPNAARRRSA